MSKEHLYSEDAERLFVIEQKSPMEIAGELSISEKTIRNWKAKGDWDKKRADYLRGRQAFHEELYEFARTLMKKVRADMEAGKDVSPGRMYALAKMIPYITKVKDYEDAAKKSGSDAEMKEALDLILESEYGIKRPQ
ncbi:MAG: DUF1804 family protein [Nitrospiraceae bacterium]|nr:DUF1804 family protein [Nitrospiraceae bacterium]